MNKKVLSILLSAVMVVAMIPLLAAATENSLMTLQQLREKNGAISFEAYNIGQGFIIKPSLYAKKGSSAGDITLNFLEENSIAYSGTTAYFTGFEFDDTTTPNFPEYLDAYSSDFEQSGDGNGLLSEFDYSPYGGWLYTINDWWASYGASDAYPGNEITDYNSGEPIMLGDVIRWHYSVYGYGVDCGFANNAMADYMGGNLFTQEDKSDLIFALAAIKDYYGNKDTDNVYETALEVASNPLATASEIANQEKIISDYIEKTYLLANNEPARKAQDVSAVLNATMAQLAKKVPNPSFGTSAGEWTVLSLARGEYFEKSNAYFTNYYNRIVEYVNEKATSVNLNGAINKSKSTDNSRVILALSSIGKNATAVGDWNLIKPYEDFDWIKKQGINGPIFALLALDTNNYAIANATIRQKCIEFIINAQLADGGWALSGTTAEPDTTAMALQALAPYSSQASVASASKKGFSVLSTIQDNAGGYASWGTVNAESCAQVIVACTAWGINPDTDSRFVKNNKSVVDALLSHYLEKESAFEHTIGSGADGMATDQACCALVSYNRFIKNKASLYDMSDVSFEKIGEISLGNPKVTLGLPSEITDDIGKTFNATISIDQWDNTAKYKLVDFIMNVPTGLSVTSIAPGKRLNGGAVSYNLDNGKLRAVYFDANNHNDLTINGTAFPAQLFTITFKVADVNAGDKLDINIEGMSIKLSSDPNAENSMLVVDTTKAFGAINVVKGVSYSAVCLYVGDDVDLIPSNKKAVAVSVVGIENATRLVYNDGTNNYEFKHSTEISNKTGVASYVALVDASISLERFANKSNYTFAKEKASEITFGDTNFDGVVNAQDALSAVDSWLRKTPNPDDDKILTLNVNADSRINTFDALGIVEAFVDNSEYLVVNKASALGTSN